uniref:Uncharacterized protein n=1 Tax=Caenorhabditis tropicalis TaxID=1561998 RepID=A0A1I7UP65_9PELO
MKEWRIQQKKEQEDSSITRREEARSKVRDVWIASFQQEVESTRKRKMRQIEERNSKRTKKMEAIEQKEITEFDCQVFEKASTIQLPNEKEEGNNE